MFELIASILILTASALVQGAIGFGFGLLAIPLLLAMDIGLPQAIAMIGPCAFFQTGIGVFHFRKDIPWRIMRGPIVMIILGTVAGTFLMVSLARFDQTLVKQIVGGVLMGLLLLQAVLRIQPREKVHPCWGWLACGAGGILGGTTGMGGPPIVMWVSAHDWSTRTVRVVKWTLFVIFPPLLFPFLYARYGNTILEAYKVSLFALPSVYLGARAGMWIGDHFSRKLLRWIVNGMLWLMVITSICGPWFK